VAAWLMNGTSYVSANLFGGRSSAAPPWRAVATGDFNGDGKTDVLWWNSSSGYVAAWLMNGTSYVSASLFGGRTYAPAPWMPVA
jgi:prolyl oligopeptidase PreP (S9A serine peptidase family)